tara:strand:+ start:180 stop:524 length:345 start_codon:yes stop_codon:yes gene_type:complete
VAKKSKRKKHKLQSKKELELEGRKIGIELDRRHSKEDLIAELEKAEKELIDEMNDEVITDVEWDTIEDFSEAVSSSGMLYSGEFIPVDILALYDSYTSNPEEFKESAAYKFLTK